MVSTPVGAMPDRLSDGGGSVVPVGDTTRMAEAIHGLLTDGDRYRAAGRAARSTYQLRNASAVNIPRLIESWNRVAL